MNNLPEGSFLDPLNPINEKDFSFIVEVKVSGKLDSKYYKEELEYQKEEFTKGIPFYFENVNSVTIK